MLDKNRTSAAADTLSADSVPTSFGVFKPVGHVMMGLPTQTQADALASALHQSGWATDAVQHFAPSEGVPELEAMADNAGAMAGFGYEITLLRRYVDLARLGYRWLLVRVDDLDHASQAAAAARQGGATLAVYYRALTVEELL